VNVVDLIEDDRALYIVQEFCSGGELFEKIVSAEEGLTERDAARIVQQVLSGIQHCHDELGVVHRDLKPENILFKNSDPDSDVVIIDFGLAGEIPRGPSMKNLADQDAMEMNLKTTVGTPYYIAPEVFSKDYGKECDIWSIGVIAYILLCGFPPFTGDNEREIMHMVKHGGPVEFPLPEWKLISKEARNFCATLMTRNPADRPTASEALRHNWFKRTDTAPLSIYKTIGSRLEMFNNMNQLKKMASMVIVSRVQDTEVRELKRLFQKIDVHNTGTIDIDELKDALDDRPEIAGMDFTAFFEGLDMDKTNKINYNEFLAAAVCPAVRLDAANIRLAFNYFDKDNSGFITAGNLATIVNSKEQARSLIGEADFRHDNKIAFDEFVAMMTMPEHKVLLSEEGQGTTEANLMELGKIWLTTDASEKEEIEKTLFTSKDLGMLLKQVKVIGGNHLPVDLTFVIMVDSKGPAFEAGISPLELLLEIDGQPVQPDTAGGLLKLIEAKGPSVTLKTGTIPGHPKFQRRRSRRESSDLTSMRFQVPE